MKQILLPILFCNTLEAQCRHRVMITFQSLFLYKLSICDPTLQETINI